MNKKQQPQHEQGRQAREIERPAVRFRSLSRSRPGAPIHPVSIRTINQQTPSDSSSQIDSQPVKTVSRRDLWSGRSWLRRLSSLRAIRSWLAVPRHYILVGASLAVFLGLVGYVVVTHQLMAMRYQLLPSVAKAVGPADTALLANVHYDSKQAVFGLSASKTPAVTGNSLSVSNSPANPGYSFQLPTHLSKGISVTDPISKLSIELTPTTTASIGHQVGNHFVYPLATAGAQDIFTVKANGLQEDIALPNGLTHSLSFAYTLKLPSDLQARQNGDGTIGIYSAASALFGNISHGTSGDQVLVDTARQNGPKNTLVFSLPAPTIEQAGKKGFPSPPTHSVQVSYQLKGGQLTLVVHVSKSVTGPIVIDPSIVVANASGFSTGNNEGDIAINTTNNTMSEAGLTGGSISAGWTATTTLLIATQDATSVAFNGYLYEIGGLSSSVVDYAPINSNGTIGAWTATTSLPAATYNATSVVYNGYLYEIGGLSGVVIATVDYAPINANGTIGAWTATTSLPAATNNATSVVYNGYLYEIGGYTSAATAVVDYAPINANGTIGAWTATTSLPAATLSATSVVYNGYVYEIGGNSGTSTVTVDYAPTNSNGTLGSWAATTSLLTATFLPTSVVYNGYVYEIGGKGGNVVDYAPTNSNGTLGSWTATTGLPTATNQATSVAYNGYLYEIGGYTSAATAVVDYAPIDPAGVVSGWTATTSLPTTTTVATSVAYNGYVYEIGGNSGGSYTTTVDYAPINSDGTIGSWTRTTTLPTRTAWATSVAYNGYLYEIGGCNTTSCSTTVATVDYAPINSDGTLGTWTATTALPTATEHADSVAYNGYVYEIGGCANTSCSITTAVVDYAPINSDGTLGSWTATTSLPTATYQATSVAYNGYLYEIGGQNGSSVLLATVDYAPINSNGTLGSWTGTASLPTATNLATSVAYNGYVYEIGGSNGSLSAVVDYAPINADGTLGSWTATTSLPAATANATSIAYNGYVYEIGGSNAPATATVDVAQINNGGPGTLSAWTATSSMPTGISVAISVAYNGYLYVIQGCTGACGGSQISTVTYSAITNTGALAAPGSCAGTLSGAWCTSTSTANGSLPQTGGNNSAVAYNGYLYDIGGFPLTGGATANVYFTAINSNGSIGTWTTTTALPVATYASTSVVYNGYVYEIGGYTTVVYYAPINSNGSLGSWATTTALPAFFSNSYAKAVAYNGYVYDVDGFNVIYAPINSNGSLGSWTTTTALPTSAGVATTVAYNGYLYQLGGWASTQIANVDYAPINSNGTIGPWTTTTSLPVGNGYAMSVVYNGYVYEIGGCAISGGCPTAAVNVAGLQSIPRVGEYSQLLDLTGSATNDPTPIEMVTNGTNTGNPGIGGVGGIGTGGITVNYSFASNACSTMLTPKTFSTGISNQLGTPFKFTFTTNGCATATNIGRYVWVRYILDDSQTASFPDINGNHTTVSNYTVYYHPASGNRLRGGATFSNGSLQTLDAPP